MLVAVAAPAAEGHTLMDSLPVAPVTPLTPRVRQRQDIRRARRLSLYEEVRALHMDGHSQRTITRSSKCPPMAQRAWCQEQLFLAPRAPTCVDLPLLRSDPSRSVSCVTLVFAETSVTAIGVTRPLRVSIIWYASFGETSVPARCVTWPLRVSVIPLAMRAAPLSFHGARRCTRPRRADQERGPARGRCTAPVRPVAVDIRLLMGHARAGPAAHARGLSCGRSGRYGWQPARAIGR